MVQLSIVAELRDEVTKALRRCGFSFMCIPMTLECSYPVNSDFAIATTKNSCGLDPRMAINAS